MSKRRALTLIEVLVTLGLLTVLLTTLMFWHAHLTQNKKTIEKQKRPLLEQRYAWQRLEAIVPKAELPFLGSEKQMIFRFDRGTSASPQLSERVLGKIEYDSESEILRLGIWPDFDEGKGVHTPSLTLPLLDRVQNVRFDYYSPPDPFKLTVDPGKVGSPQPKTGWQQVWRYDRLPAFVRIDYSRDGREWTWYFDLNQPILYPLEPK